MRLEATCDKSPEQYNAWDGKMQVGYLRLRHGEFTVRCPDVNGELVFYAEPKGDGCFEDDERENFLTEAKDAIQAWMKAKPATDP